MGGQHGCEMVGQFYFRGGDQFARLFQRFVPHQPVLVATSFPSGQVWGVDGGAIKISGQDALDFGQGVEPGEQPLAGLAIQQALVQLVADFARLTGDFSRTCLGFIPEE